MYASAEQILRRGVAEVLAPREELTLDEWSDRHAVLPSEGTGSARAGRWDTDNTPYLREIMRRMTDPEVNEIAVWKSAQTGATVGLIINDALYRIGVLRRPMMIVYPTRDKGKDVNKRKLIPALRACDVTRGLIARARDITDQEINLGGTPLWFAFTKSDSQMRSDSVAHIRFDELDVCIGTGINDPQEEARQRQKTFHEKLLFKTSTPDFNETGIIHEYKTAGVRWTYRVPCPFTGQFFELFHFDQLGWFGGPRADPEKARANCWVISPFARPGETLRIGEHCKAWMARNGVWVTQDEQVESDGSILATLDRTTGRELGLDGEPVFRNAGRLTSDFFRAADQEPDRRKRDAGLDPDDAERIRARLGVKIVGKRNRGQRHGYRFNALVSLIDAAGWGGIVFAYTQAKGMPDDTWHKQTLAHVPDRTKERIEVARLSVLCTGPAHGVVPRWAIACFTLVDVQKDCIKIGVWAYGPEGIDRALVYTRRQPRDERNELREPELRAALRDISLAYEHADTRVRPLAVFIDSGHWTEDVYGLVRWLERQGAKAWPVKGRGREQASGKTVWLGTVTEKRLPDGSMEARPDPINLYHYSDDELSQNFVSRIANHPDPETGEITELSGLDLTAEQLLGGRIVLPGSNWDDRDEVLEEMSNIQHALIGAGSGLSGNDGKGPRRMAWRKKHQYLGNDWFDVGKMNQIPVKAFQLDRWTADKVAQILATLKTDPQPEAVSDEGTPAPDRREDTQPEPIAARLARLRAGR